MKKILTAGGKQTLPATVGSMRGKRAHQDSDKHSSRKSNVCLILLILLLCGFVPVTIRPLPLAFYTGDFLDFSVFLRKSTLIPLPLNLVNSDAFCFQIERLW